MATAATVPSAAGNTSFKVQREEIFMSEAGVANTVYNV